MNKIKLWILNNKTNIVIIFSSLSILSVLSLCLILGLNAHKISLEQKQLKACDEAYKMLCVQVHACSKAPVKECDAFVAREKLCEPVQSLSMIEIINACTEDLRNIECEDQLPGTCQTFMDK